MAELLYTGICRVCEAGMCADCKSLADEWPTLLYNWKRQCSRLEHEKKVLEAEVAHLRNTNASYSEVIAAGLPALVEVWVASQLPEELLERIRESKGDGS